MQDSVLLDGRRGEGGGQILRSALALSLATGRPFRLEHLRARRARPGLLPQHLAAVRLAAVLGAAEVDGAERGSRVLDFRPTRLGGGAHAIEVGSAGSTALVLQAVLPPLLWGGEAATLVLGGGTHARGQPPFEFLDGVWLRALREAGARVTATLRRPGFHPAGGGCVEVRVDPARPGRPPDLQAIRARERVTARAYVAGLPRSIAERELAVIARRLDGSPDVSEVVEVEDPVGPGNAVVLVQEHEGAADTALALGAPGRPAEQVAAEVVHLARAWRRAGVPVGPWLADQLMVPLALGAGGRYRTGVLSSHARTNVGTLQAFLGDVVDVRTAGPGVVEVMVRGRHAASAGDDTPTPSRAGGPSGSDGSAARR